jgi:uncharacterized membrane protein YphA (DoxX/SURF4 family)
MSKLEGKAFLLLRLSLGFVFLWFGVLKLFAAGDGLSVLQASLPQELAFSQLFSFFVSFLEILLGFSFLLNKFIKPSALVAFVYLLLTGGFILVSQGFDPRFPVLSSAGESAVKNLVLAAAALVLLSENGAGKDPKTETL